MCRPMLPFIPPRTNQIKNIFIFVKQLNILNFYTAQGNSSIPWKHLQEVLTYLLTARYAVGMYGSKKGPPFLSVLGHLFDCPPGVVHGLHLSFYSTPPYVFQRATLALSFWSPMQCSLSDGISISSNHVPNLFPTPS